MKRFVPLFIFLTFLLSGCDSNREKTVFVSDLRGAELNFDGDISLMTNGWLRLNHRKGDNTWALGLKIQDYDELVYDAWNCTTEFEPEDDRFTFSNSAVRMVINVTETDCFINLFTVDDQSITVSMWPTARKDAGKIRRGIEEYCKYTSAPVISQTDTVANFIEATGPEESDFSPSRETNSDPEMATAFEDTQFYVSKEKSGNDVYYKGESDHVMSEYLTQIYVEMISKPDPNKSTDIGNSLFFLNYSGKIGQDALDIMKRYDGETVEARFFFSNGKSYLYPVSVDDLTPTEWEEMDSGLGYLYLCFTPFGSDSYDKDESRNAYDAATTEDIIKMVIGGKTINLLDQGFHTGYLFGHLFALMAREGAFGPKVAENLSSKKSSSSTTSQTSSTRQSPSSKPAPKTDPANGHEWVDMGLSVKWATCNVGASKPSGLGDYFSWGETDPMYAYNSDHYVFGDDSNNYTKYNKSDGKMRLDLSDDAAHVKWGGGWRMPTIAEFDELQANCTVEWAQWEDGTPGVVFTSRINGNQVFFPAAGIRSGDSVDGYGNIGCYWSSTRLDNPFGARIYLFNRIDRTIGMFRTTGYSVRGVLK